MYERDWEAVAVEHGFDSSEEMLRELYLVQLLSAGAISKELKIPRPSIYLQLKRLGIPTREKGLPRGNIRVRLGRMSYARLFGSNPKELADKLGVNISTIYAERQRRTKLEPEEDIAARREAAFSVSSPPEPLPVLKMRLTDAELRAGIDKIFNNATNPGAFFESADDFLNEDTTNETVPESEPPVSTD